MRIRYVVSTMVFWWREHHLSLEQECDYLRNLGYGVELWPTIKGHIECRYDRRNWSRLQQATDSMLVALNSRTDGPTLADWAEQIACAQLLKAPIVAGLSSLCVSEELGIADWGFAAEVVRLAEQHGVTLCVETGNLATVCQFGDRFDSIRYCLDTGFAHIDPKNRFREYVDRLFDRTTYLHLTDNYGQIDDHEPPGVRGGMPRENWDYLLNRLSQNGHDVIGSLEMFPCMPGTMIHQAGKFLFDVLGWPQRPEKTPGYDEYTYRPL
ncbi:MAG: sugar phosphate isomerase/epimerase [Sedimentisphaerales bacterium]|nr:sugar phosphate isomerase/epimerase [Sedimentisphaerales bacterium]